MKPPHIVHIVGNTVSGDSRVRKSAVSAAGAGFQVTVVGARTSDDAPAESVIGSVRVIRARIGTRFRAHAGRRGGHAVVVRRLVAQQRIRGEDWLAMLRDLRAARAAVLERPVTRHRARIAQCDALGAPRWLTFGVRAASVMVMRTERAMGSMLIGLRMVGIEALRRSHRFATGVRLKYHRPRSVIGAAEPTVHELPARQRRRLLVPGARTPRSMRWRRVLTVLFDFDDAMRTLVDELEPDVVHAHDMNMIDIAVRVARQRRRRGLTTRVVYDAHEYVRGYSHHFPASIWRAHLDHESEYIGAVDEIITVSDALAARLQTDYGLASTPTVVHNAPMPLVAGPTSQVPPLRATLGIAADVPLLVHSGSASPARGIGIVADALVLLPDVHVALVSNSPIAQQYVDRAAELGVGERLHLTPYVETDQVIAHLRDATAGLVFLRHCGNHEVALPNKLFEYLHSGLPILCAEVGVAADFVRRHGLGETFAADDAESFARAARCLIDRQAELRRHVAGLERLRSEFSWPSQHRRLIEIYSRVTSLQVVNDECDLSTFVTAETPAAQGAPAVSWPGRA